MSADPDAGTSTHPAPSGWYRLAWSADLGESAVLAVDAFDEPYALYRTAAGQAKLIDPFCPHMGASLAHGGCVEADRLVCPFHGWQWDATGHNVHIPYSERLSRRTVGHHPVQEAAGAVWGWLATDDPTVPLGGLPDEAMTANPGRTWTLTSRLLAAVDLLADGPFLGRLLNRDISDTAVEPRDERCRIVHRNSDVEEIVIELQGRGAAVIELSHCTGRVLQTHTERARGVLELGATTLDAGDALDTWATMLDHAVPILDQAVPVDQLDDLTCERPVSLARAWLTGAVPDRSPIAALARDGH